MGHDPAAWASDTGGDSSPHGDSNGEALDAERIVLRVESKKVSDAVRAARRDAAEDDGDGADSAAFELDSWPSPEQIGRGLTRLRITDRRRSGRQRYRVLTREHLDRLVNGHGGDASFEAVDPLTTTVTTGPTVTSNGTVAERQAAATADAADEDDEWQPA
jgi:hypothetical protein